MNWTKPQEEQLRELYPIHTNREIAEVMEMEYYAVMYKGKNMGLKKSKETKQRACGISDWTPERLRFLKENFDKMTNRQLADHIGLTLTVVRNKTRELGFKHMELEYWTEDQVRFLEENYRTMGDVELADYFQKHWPKNKKWVKQHINKKRDHMNLVRTADEVAAIVKVNVSQGGRQYTIDRNSACVTLPDKYVANCIAWRNPQLKEEVLKHPDIIKLKREQLLLSRAIKEVKHGA